MTNSRSPVPFLELKPRLLVRRGHAVVALLLLSACDHTPQPPLATQTTTPQTTAAAAREAIVPVTASPTSVPPTAVSAAPSGAAPSPTPPPELTPSAERPRIVLPAKPQPGVVVRDGQALSCVALCRGYTSPTQAGANNDGANDDWAWENNSTCIIPGSATQRTSQRCTTGKPLPKPLQRPGIYVNTDPTPNRCATSSCVPLCKQVKTPTHSSASDWGYEYAAACVLPGSATARVIGGDAERAIATNGYAVPPRTCTFGTPPTDFMQPPIRLQASRVKKPHFYTDGATLRDPYGAPFLVRGVNNSHAWYDICGQYAAFGALEALAKTGANSVRIGWAFHSIDPGGPGSDAPEKPIIGTYPLLLAEILHRALALKLVPIITFNDSTGQTDSAWPIKMAQLITAPGYKQVFQAYEPFILLGIANEWNGADFTAAYTPAVATLRNAELKLPLVITGNAWGQGCKPIIEGAPALIDSDPQHNLLFDLHIYTYISYPLAGASNTEAGGEPPRVAACLDEIAAHKIPLVVGEFGESHSSGAVAWQTIIARADANQQGYVPWVWYGDTEYRQLNMNQQWSGPLTAWGKQAVSGFAKTAKHATIFR